MQTIGISAVATDYLRFPKMHVHYVVVKLFRTG
ncbi:hypothetical protein B0G69_0092 [Paraburkholderia sp. RAU2J]|nr:hypothetical protein B0G69_0092 [Paraburkholderia sp. RAU2J]